MGELINKTNNIPRPIALYYLLLAKTKKIPMWYVGITNNPIYSLGVHDVDIKDKNSYFYFNTIVSVLKETKLLMKQNEIFIFNDDNDLYSDNDNDVYIYLYKVVANKTNETPNIKKNVGESIVEKETKNENISDESFKKEIPIQLKEKMDKVPWNNIVHFYGRASDFPNQIQIIFEGNNQHVYKDILDNIEHQDSISQATPFMLQILLELLNYSVDKISILNICYKVWEDIKYFFTYNECKKPSADSMKSLLNKEFLWPDYKNEKVEENLWNEFSSKNNFYDWNYYTMKVFYENKKNIGNCILSSDTKLKQIAERLFNEIGNR